MPEYVIWLLAIGAVAFLAGAALLTLARRADRRNYTIQKATPLPLALVNERDDVWLRGRAECNAPVAAPHFGFACLHYRYELEERVRRTHTDSKGRTHTSYEWKTRQRASESAVFHLREGDLAIEVDGPRADFRDLQTRIERIGDWRHTVYYLPVPATVSAVGSVSERRERLEPYEDIPLVVTPKPRDEFVRAAERAETLMRGAGFTLVWLGGSCGLYGAFDLLGWPVATGAAFRAEILAAALGAGTALFAVVWAAYIYNTLVTYAVRVENAWRQVDVDLKMRYTLIPQLLGAVKGFTDHEHGLLERLAALRGEALAGGTASKIAAEGRLAGALGRLVAVAEKYPNLKSQPLVEKLMRELTAIEEKIAHGRTVYNESVREYNENVLCFPRMILARAFGFGTRGFFEIAGPEREAVEARLAP